MSCNSSCPSQPVQYHKYLSTCLNKCPNQTFEVSNVCTHCSPECSTCYGAVRSKCLSCNPRYYLDTTFCAGICPTARKYKDTVSNICRKSCPVGTLTVVALSECHNVCPAGYLVYQKLCLIVFIIS